MIWAEEALPQLSPSLARSDSSENRCVYPSPVTQLCNLITFREPYGLIHRLYTCAKYDVVANIIHG